KKVLSMGKQQNSHALRNSLSVTELSRQPFPGSEKIHIPGSRPDLQVALREIHLTPTRLASGGEEINPPLRVYDTSGPYTDPAVPGRVVWVRAYRGCVKTGLPNGVTAKHCRRSVPLTPGFGK